MSKLVRDRVSEFFPDSLYRTLTTAEYAEALRDKLAEETREYLADRTPEELADVLEVLRALAALHGLPPEGLEALRARKAAERGSFSGRIWLETRDEKPGETPPVE